MSEMTILWRKSEVIKQIIYQTDLLGAPEFLVTG